MRLAVVTPRYGAEVVGGAETAARMFATRLASRPGWSVEVLTTTALDSTTWRDHFPPGVVEDDGVAVHRFRVTGTRSREFDALSTALFAMGRRATIAAQQDWVERQGPVSPELLEAIAASNADAIAFHPYLYQPTVKGVALAGDRAILHAAAHDEPPLRLQVYRDVFEQCGGLVFWSEAERRLASAMFAIGAKPQQVLGLGVEAGVGDAAAAREQVGLDDRPFLLCLGRVDNGKGARVLAESFSAYKSRRPGPLALVFAGPIVHSPPAHPDVIVAGAVAEEVKWGLLRGATTLVSASAYESFSIVLLEAWSVGTPVLVSSRCEVMRDHARQSGGGLMFSCYAELEACLDRLLHSPDLIAALGGAGREYAESRYRWSDLVDRYASFVRSVAYRAGGDAPGGDALADRSSTR